jgi:Kelch motif
MKVRHVLTVIALLLSAGGAFAQNPNCRQSWMPLDTPVFCPWQSEPTLPEARTYHAVATSDNNIYVLGGFRFEASTNQVIYYDSVVRSTIGTEGRLTIWTPEPSFKSARSGAAATAVGGCLFLAGGSSSTPNALTYFDDIQYTRINPDGRLSPWTTSPSHLRIPRSNLSLVAVTTDQGTFLEAVAGVTQIGADTIHLDTIEIANVATDCTVSEWRVASYHLKGGRSTPQALAVRNNTVVIGGWGDLDLIDVY